MDRFVTLQEIDQAAEFVRGRTSHHPKIRLILGSGLGELAVDESANVKITFVRSAIQKVLSEGEATTEANRS